MSGKEERKDRLLEQLNPEDAIRLFDAGAFMIMIDFPEGSEFGIDFKSWTVGPKFKGLKMIPPGIHYIYYSCVAPNQYSDRAPRLGFFHNFSSKEILVKKWNSKLEDLSDESISDEEIERYRQNIRQLDSFLGPYPFEEYRTWFSLSNHLTESIVAQLRPLHGRISAQAELVTMEAESLNGEKSKVDRLHPNRIRYCDERGLPVMRIREGYELRFHDIPKYKPLLGQIGPTRSQLASDASDRLDSFLAEYYPDDQCGILGELQFAFITFLIGHVYISFEQWKLLVNFMCDCKRALLDRCDLYMAFLMVLHYQLKQCPADFFVDIVSKDNFLTVTLGRLFANLEASSAAKGLRDKATKFKAYLSRTYKWNFDLDSDQPIVVTNDG